MKNEKKIQITWWSQQQALMIKHHDNGCMISIYTTYDLLHKFNNPWKWFWQAAFHDSDGFSSSLYYPPISDTQAKSLFKFISKIEEREITHVYVHCDAGVSRSAGIARFVADYYKSDFPSNYSQYNKTVYRSLVEAHQDIDGIDESYEDLWSKI